MTLEEIRKERKALDELLDHLERTRSVDYTEYDERKTDLVLEVLKGIASDNYANPGQAARAALGGES